MEKAELIERLKGRLGRTDRGGDQVDAGPSGLITDQAGLEPGRLVTDQAPVPAELDDVGWNIVAFCEVPRSMAEIIGELGLTHRTFFRRNHLEPLLAGGAPRMTHPDQPKHPDQAYVLTQAGVALILHYTEPGDLVLDCFAGTGMTGVAAQWCGTAPESYRKELEALWAKEGFGKPSWGLRRTIQNDLSPVAGFIAANYGLPFDLDAFAAAGRALLDEVEAEFGLMYETLHTDGETKGRIDYTVWSEVFSCPDCTGEVVFTDEALDEASGRVSGPTGSGVQGSALQEGGASSRGRRCSVAGCGGGRGWRGSGAAEGLDGVAEASRDGDPPTSEQASPPPAPAPAPESRCVPSPSPRHRPIASEFC